MSSPLSHLRTVSNQDGAAISDSRQGKITTLNSTGGMIWEMLQAGESLEVIKASLVRMTGASQEEVGADVNRFLADLREKNLL